MALYFEDTERVSKKQIDIPLNAKKIFKGMEKMYKQYLDKNVDGSKILKSLANDKQYNKKSSANTKLNGKSNQDSVSVNDAKVRLHRQAKYPKNSVQYQLYGGDLAHDILKRGVERSRGVKEVDVVKPQKPSTVSSKSIEKSMKKDLKVPNGNIRIEGKLNESEDWHVFNDYIAEYDTSYVLDKFLENPSGHEDWGVLINPSMYNKALQEFVKYGSLNTFPSKYVYQWFGIIMRNTAILQANTELAGHTEFMDNDAVCEFFEQYYEDRSVSIGDGNLIQFSLTQNDVLDFYDKGEITMPQVEQIESIPQDIPLDDMIEELNDGSRQYEIKYEDGNLYLEVEIFDALDGIGLYDWMTLPDGSDAWSDYGIEPLMNIIQEYDENLSPEKVLVLVNKALDVYHQRGDLASAFVRGGSKVLDSISEGKKRNLNRKKIYIKENQIRSING